MGCCQSRCRRQRDHSTHDNDENNAATALCKTLANSSKPQSDDVPRDNQTETQSQPVHLLPAIASSTKASISDAAPAQQQTDELVARPALAAASPAHFPQEEELPLEIRCHDAANQTVRRENPLPSARPGDDIVRAAVPVEIAIEIEPKLPDASSSFVSSSPSLSASPSPSRRALPDDIPIDSMYHRLHVIQLEQEEQARRAAIRREEEQYALEVAAFRASGTTSPTREE